MVLQFSRSALSSAEPAEALSKGVRRDAMERTIKTEDLKEQLASGKDIMLLDVRRRSDYDADKDTLPNATWRDPEKVDEWSKELPRDKEVVIFCARGGSVSNTVIDRLLDKKIQAQYLEGGIAAWKAAKGVIKEK
jgi:rhodanese-related sulfurtransferase